MDIKIKTSLIFGIKEKNNIRFSNVEKTILDFIYIESYSSIPEDKILLDVSEFAEKTNRDKLFEYLEKYPKSVRKIVEQVSKKLNTRADLIEKDFMLHLILLDLSKTNFADEFAFKGGTSLRGFYFQQEK